jgi:hypothetical protein
VVVVVGVEVEVTVEGIVVTVEGIFMTVGASSSFIFCVV